MKISVSKDIVRGFKVYEANFELLKKIVAADVHYSNLIWADGYRLGDNYIAGSDCLIFDFDEIVTIDMVMQWFAKYQKLICTTKSHQINKNGVVCDRFRLVLPLYSPIDLDRYQYTIINRYLAERFNADTQSTDAARKYVGYRNCSCFTTSGVKFDWEVFYSLALEWDRTRKQEREIKAQKYKNSSSTILNPDTWARAFKPETIGLGERNDRLSRIAFWLRNEGADYNCVINALNFVNQAISSPLDNRELLIIAKSKFRK